MDVENRPAAIALHHQMLDIDDQRLARALHGHDRKMIGVADSADLDRIEADEPRRAYTRPESEIARIAPADAVVEHGFGRFEIEAAVAAIAFGCVAVLLVERQLRRRAEGRLEKAIEDLSRLLSTDAQAGSVLSQRVNALTELNLGKRLDTIESDLKVLGSVVQHVTETVADLEEHRRYSVEDRQKPAPEPEAEV